MQWCRGVLRTRSYGGGGSLTARVWHDDERHVPGLDPNSNSKLGAGACRCLEYLGGALDGRFSHSLNSSIFLLDFHLHNYSLYGLSASGNPCVLELAPKSLQVAHLLLPDQADLVAR